MRILDAEKVYGEAPIFKEPRIIGDWILWLEQRPNEKGRTTALIRPWGQKDVLPQELTPYPSDLRTKIHGYGGAPLTATLDGADLLQYPEQGEHYSFNVEYRAPYGGFGGSLMLFLVVVLFVWGGLGICLRMMMDDEEAKEAILDAEFVEGS